MPAAIPELSWSLPTYSEDLTLRNMNYFIIDPKICQAIISSNVACLFSRLWLHYEHENKQAMLR